MGTVSTDRRRGITSGAAIKVACIAGSTGNLTLSGEQTVDGIALVTGDRVLAKNQTTASENGIYRIDTSTWQREPDWDGSYDVVEGTIAPVSRGTVNTNTMWGVSTTGSIIIGTTSVSFQPVVVSVSSAVTYQPAGTGAVATTVQSKLREQVSVFDFMTAAEIADVQSGSPVLDHRVAIQTVWDTGKAFMPDGTYIVSGSGSSISGREYGLLLKSGMHITGESMYGVILKVADSSEIDLINTDRSSSQSNIELRNMTLDGNEANQGVSVNGFNLWLYDIDGVVLDNIYSLNPASWGIRPEQITNMSVGTIRTNHAANPNADGVHLIDCSACVLDKIIIDTAGDDGFIITAENDDCHDITVNGLVVTAPVTTAAAGRGIMLNTEGTTVRSIYNITINAVTRNCKGSCLSVNEAQFRNIDITLSDYGSDTVNLVAGHASFAGYIRNSSFKIKSWDSTGNCIDMVLVDGVIENNHIELIGYNPADGSVGASVKGDHWDGSINIDYDPDSSKVSPLFVVDVFGSHNNLNITTDAGTKGINCRGGAIGNTFRLGSILNASVNSVSTSSGANDNKFIGGVIDAAPSISGTGNQFIGVTGGNAYGAQSVSPDANGNGTIAHTLQGTPSFMMVGIRGDNANGVDVQSVDGTNITVRIKDAAGADVTAGSFTIIWEASL